MLLFGVADAALYSYAIHGLP